MVLIALKSLSLAANGMVCAVLNKAGRVARQGATERGRMMRTRAGEVGRRGEDGEGMEEKLVSAVLLSVATEKSTDEIDGWRKEREERADRRTNLSNPNLFFLVKLDRKHIPTNPRATYYSPTASTSFSRHPLAFSSPFPSSSSRNSLSILSNQAGRRSVVPVSQMEGLGSSLCRLRGCEPVFSSLPVRSRIWWYPRSINDRARLDKSSARAGQQPRAGTANCSVLFSSPSPRRGGSSLRSLLCSSIWSRVR